MYFLSLDQSLTNTGVAHIKYSKLELESIEIDTIVTTKLNKSNIGVRLDYISQQVAAMLFKDKYVDHTFIEGIFSHLNVKTLISLAKVQGVIESQISKIDGKYSIISPREWQVYFNLTKIKDKEKSVQYILNTPDIYNKIINKDKINQHNADAILIGLFGINQLKLN